MLTKEQSTLDLDNLRSNPLSLLMALMSFQIVFAQGK